MADSYESILSRVKAFSATLIAVSKKQSVEKIAELYRKGQRDFGENYVQELVEKSAILPELGCEGIRWHFIGHLQSNKVKTLCEKVIGLHAVHSVESVRVARLLSEHRKSGEVLEVFLEVNPTGSLKRTGFSHEELEASAREIASLPGLIIQGLMCIPEEDQDPRKAFQALAAMSKNLGNLTQGKLSMGMSSDFEIALEVGATHVRIGTLLFGPRNLA